MSDRINDMLLDQIVESDLCECDRPDEGDNPHRHLMDVACVYWIAGRPTPEKRRAAAEGRLPLTQPATDEEARRVGEWEVAE